MQSLMTISKFKMLIPSMNYVNNSTTIRRKQSANDKHHRISLPVTLAG